MGKKSIFLAAAVLSSIGMVILTSPTSAVAYGGPFYANGTVFCPRGNPVVGVWVSAGSASGWAKFSILRPSDPSIASYTFGIGSHMTYHLNVGCGGNPNHWRYNAYEGANLIAGMSWNVVCGSSTCYTFDVEVP